jgi:hypothetical protein
MSEKIMELQHLNVKVFSANPEAIRLTDFTGIFNGWIQAQANDELLIDVADYAHVHAGPGVLLIGHEANYSIDDTGNRPGLLYNRKAAVNGTIQEKLKQAVTSALSACRRLEKDHAVTFGGQEIEVIINDRLLAPNTRATFEQLVPDLKTFFGKLYGDAAYTLEHDPDPRHRFTVKIKAASPITVDALLRNLS